MASPGTTIASKSWASGDVYDVKAQARCANHITIVSPWSTPLSVTIIKIALSVISPNGGESLKAGSRQTIRWSYTGNPGARVKIELLKGGAVNRVIKSLASKGRGGNGSINWRIPSTQTPGNDYQIRITSTSNNSCSDTSDGNFTISE